MPKSKSKRILIFAIIHFVVSMLALLAALSGLSGFDDDQSSWWEGPARSVWMVLMFPAMALHSFINNLFGVHVNDFFEWLIAIANSIAYALFIDYIIFKLFLSTKRGAK